MFEAQIANGVALLDEKVPGWLDRIDVKRLDMESGQMLNSECGCVLTQLDAICDWPVDDGTGTFADERYDIGVYERGLLGLRLTYDSAADYGFCTGDDDIPWSRLTAEWKNTIARLRAEAGAR